MQELAPRDCPIVDWEDCAGGAGVPLDLLSAKCAKLHALCSCAPESTQKRKYGERWRWAGWAGLLAIKETLVFWAID